MKTNLAPFAPSNFGFFTNQIAKLTAENNELEKQYLLETDEAECKRIARLQNRNENRINRLKDSLAEGYSLR